MMMTKKILLHKMKNQQHKLQYNLKNNHADLQDNQYLYKDMNHHLKDSAMNIQIKLMLMIHMPMYR